MTENQTDPALDELLCFDLYAAQHAFGRLYKPLLAPLELTYPQYLVMRTLWANGAQSVGEIGRRLKLETNTVTPLLKRLETQGRVMRVRDPADERRVLVSLTDDGAALEADARHVPDRIFAATGLDRGEALELQARLRKLVARIDATG
ncbi:Organic hydroperoxide resistance transcriptional regulator [Roseivivax jejudonensis]|uniref:Organic hydroperoxide resistance transcriptional regulator n=1 Tax=Roseivivax jejudonensis TaxID=1529041 RepID=A0A1X6YL55_9RHOB|nr:MarR family transcriptional regulator [Roseivivax jejudonensis]SLN24474.1 Organic hydroperoxide resistance transcriptional regulator [Roseivivax jejudonensis]